MKVKIDEVLTARGKTRNWLAEETGIAYNNLKKLCDGNTVSVNFEIADKICSALNCNISDIFSHDYIQVGRVLNYQKKNKRNER